MAMWDAALQSVEIFFYPLFVPGQDARIQSPILFKFSKVQFSSVNWTTTNESDSRPSLIRKAVVERGNGQAGPEHIEGSLRKWVHALEILSTEKGQQLTISYDFSEGKKSRQQEHLVQGTAGHWPPHQWK
jgi:hypothetical protein